MIALFLSCALALPPSQSFPNAAKVRSWQEFSEFLIGVDPANEYFLSKDKPPLAEHGWKQLPFVFDGYRVFGRHIPTPMAMVHDPADDTDPEVKMYLSLAAFWNQSYTKRKSERIRMLFPLSEIGNAWALAVLPMNVLPVILSRTRINIAHSVVGFYGLMPFPDDSFHVVTMIAADTRYYAILEAKRVLKNYGFLVLAKDGSEHLRHLVESFGFERLNFPFYKEKSIFQKIPKKLKDMPFKRKKAKAKGHCAFESLPLRRSA